MIVNKSQVYCDACKTSYWLELSTKIAFSSSGLMRKSLIHHDHVLIVDIDTNGVVRDSHSVPIEHDPMKTLIGEVAEAFHYINGEPGKPLLIDCYTSNQQLMMFIQGIITKMFEQATTKRVDNKFKFTASTFSNRTILYSDRIHLSIGPYSEPKFGNLKDAVKGILIDTDEIERNELDIETTLNPYNWAAVIVPSAKREGYEHVLSSLFEERKIPYFIDSLNNQSLKDLFDFIFEVSLDE